MPRTAAALVLCVLIAVLAGCGGSDSKSADAGASASVTEKPTGKPFPGTEQRSVSQISGQEGQGEALVLAPSGVIHRVGPKERFAFGLFDVGGKPIEDPSEVALYVQAPDGGRTTGPIPVRRESLAVDKRYASQTSKGDAQAVYVADVEFKRPGAYTVAALVHRDGKTVAAKQAGDLRASNDTKIPAVGDRAPSVSTPTVAKDGPIAKIDTRSPPDSMHDVDLKDVLGHKPVVLLFATPLLCQSRVCGPVTDVAEQVKNTGGDDSVAFIHNEIYNDNKPDAGLRPQVKAYGLQTEPWLFVIDAHGRVSTEIEGAFSAEELQRAIDKAK